MEFQKKKKKKSFMQKAKKFGKRGQFGKGQNIDEKTYNYFLQVLDNLDKNDFEDEESKEMFAANVFASNCQEEEKLCCNQLVSRVFEKLLPLAPHAAKIRLMSKLGSDLRLYVTNPFASHVLETLLVLASFRQKNEPQEDSNEFEAFRHDWLVKVSKYCFNNFVEFAQDQYASHVLRRLLECLSGQEISTDLLKSKRSQNQAQTKLDLIKISKDNSIFKDTFDPEIQGIFALVCKKIEDSEEFKDLCLNEVSSEVLQTLLIILASKSDCKLAKKLSKQITNEMFAEKNMDMFERNALCRLMEVLVQVSGDNPDLIKIYNHFHQVIFKTHLAEFSKHPQANFGVQKLIQHCPKKEIFEEMFEQELDEMIGQVFTSGCSPGVLLSIGQACRKLAAKQAHYLAALGKAFNCFEKNQEKFFLYLISFQASDSYEDGKPIHLQGSLLAQEILHFNKPIKLINSILATEPEKLAKILSDPRGCHVTDAFMTSSSIGEKSRESLIKHLQDFLLNISCSKHGSRSIDAIWNKGSLKLRELLASKMACHENKLNSDPFGKFIASNLGLALFKRNKDLWKSNFDKVKKTKQLFSDFLKKPKENHPVKQVEICDFMIEKSGDENLLKRKMDEDSSNEDKVKKKKKKETKSYLDDL